MKRRYFILAACATMPVAALAEADIFSLPRHWFTLTWPEGFRLSRLLDNGYRFSESGMLRNPMDIEITVALSDHDQSITTWSTRQVDGFIAPFHFQITAEEGGSGGTLYILTAKGYDNENLPVTLLAQTQSELGTPDFTIAWKTLATYTIQ